MRRLIMTWSSLTSASGAATVLAQCRSLLWLSGLALVGITLGWIAWLGPEWCANPDLTHGLFTLPAVVALIVEARGGPQRYHSGGRLWLTITSITGLLALLALSATGVSVAALTAQSALSLWLGTVALCLTLAAVWFVAAHRAVRLLPLNFCAGAILLLVFLSAPLPPGTQMRLTLELQLWVTELVVRSLDFAGLAAHRMGAVIELPNGQVGVDEACSGVRSLISCVYAAVFLAAVFPRGWFARMILLATAVPGALALNFTRSFILTLLAVEGYDLDRWHDLTGYSILMAGTGCLTGLACMLARHEQRRRPLVSLLAKPATVSFIKGQLHLPGPWVGGLATGLTAVVLGSLFFVWALRPISESISMEGASRLDSLLPKSVPGWRMESDSELYRFASTLRTEDLLQRTYVSGPPERLVAVTVYLASWAPGQAPVSLVASHSPDACWPGAGWSLAEGVPDTVELKIGERTLTPAQQRVFQVGEAGRHVWFWHFADKRPVAYAKPTSALSLMRLVLQQGVLRPQAQLFVRISSNAPWPLLAQDPLFTELVERLGPEGLLPNKR